MNISAMHMLCLGLLFVMLIVFSVLGFRAMKPGSSQKSVDAFWISILIFLGVLAVYIFIWVSPILSVAPLFPMFIFGRLFVTTRQSQKKLPEKTAEE